MYVCTRIPGGMVLGPHDTKVKGWVLLKELPAGGVADTRKASTYVLGQQKARRSPYWLRTGRLVSSEDLSSVTHYHHCTGHVACPQSFSFPTEDFRSYTLKGCSPNSVITTVPRIHQAACLPAPIPRKTFPEWMAMVTSTFPDEKSWHHLWFFPFTSNGTVHSDLRKALRFLYFPSRSLPASNSTSGYRKSPRCALFF